MFNARFIVADVFDGLAQLDDGSVDLVVTSPPFLALRSYLPADHPDKDKEIGSEATPAEFIDVMLAVTKELRRVLAPHGSLCVELGDTYSGTGGAGGDWSDSPKTTLARISGGGDGGPPRRSIDDNWPLAKSKTLIPQLYEIALAYGFNPLTGQESPAGKWRIRNVVTWARPNPPVGALGDKWRPATSDVVVAATSDKRYWDDLATRKPHQNDRDKRPVQVTTNHGGNKESRKDFGEQFYNAGNTAAAPLLDYWEIPPTGYSGAHYACVDEETEALTPYGWKQHSELEDGEKIAAYDAWRDVLRWEEATFHRYDYDGVLVAIDQRETVQRLTENHRVLYRTRSSDDPKVVLAGDLRASHRLPVAAPFESGQWFSGPGEKMMALLGWYITEGQQREQSRQAYIYQSLSANPENCDRIRTLLDAVDAEYDERHRTRGTSVEAAFVVKGQIARFLRRFSRQIPKDVLGMSDGELQALFDALIDGDGHRRPSGRMSFVSKDRYNTDMFQAVASRLGYRSTIHQRKNGMYETTVGERSWLSLRGTNGASKGIGREHYNGVVWCPSVASSFWLARRSGRPFITGNTFPPALVEPLVKAMCPQKVCRECGEPSRRIVENAAPTGGAYIETTKGNGARIPGTGDRGGSGVPMAEPTTLGFTDCGHDNYRPGLVLDPFAGTGTTLMVATGHGHDAIGIDLDERNAELAMERVGPFLLEVENV